MAMSIHSQPNPVAMDIQSQPNPVATAPIANQIRRIWAPIANQIRRMGTHSQPNPEEGTHSQPNPVAMGIHINQSNPDAMGTHSQPNPATMPAQAVRLAELMLKDHEITDSRAEAHFFSNLKKNVFFQIYKKVIFFQI